MTATHGGAARPRRRSIARDARLLLALRRRRCRSRLPRRSILLAPTLVCWVALLVRDRTRPSAPAFFLPLVVYAGADARLVGVLARPGGEPHRRQTARAPSLIVPARLRPRARRARGDGGRRHRHRRRRERRGRHRPVRHPALRQPAASGRRASLTHYMTYSGRADAGASARRCRALVFGARDRIWPALVMPALVVALALTLGAQRLGRRLRRGGAAAQRSRLPADRDRCRSSWPWSSRWRPTRVTAA